MPSIVGSTGVFHSIGVNLCDHPSPRGHVNGTAFLWPAGGRFEFGAHRRLFRSFRQAVSDHASGCWCAVRQATAAVTEPKRLRREIREEHQRILSGADDPVRRGIVAGRHSFVAHYHNERNHQGLANRLILPEAGHLGNAGTNAEAPAAVGGMLNYYYRTAACIHRRSRGDRSPRRDWWDARGIFPDHRLWTLCQVGSTR